MPSSTMVATSSGSPAAAIMTPALTPTGRLTRSLMASVSDSDNAVCAESLRMTID